MAKFNVPKRKYFDGDKKRMVSWRLPEPLMKALDAVAKDKGWTTTELVTTALDQYVQWETKNKAD